MLLAPANCPCFQCRDHGVYVCVLCFRSVCRAHARLTALSSYCCLCAPLGADPA
jgi:hypothetical protein